MKGFHSTTKNKTNALKLAMQSDAPTGNPVLIEIQWKDKWRNFRLNNPHYSLYPEEQEILLQDGTWFDVLSIDKRATE